MSAELVSHPIRINSGEFAFAEGKAVLETVLGSCVAITFWDSRHRVGAMCHYLLPERPKRSEQKEAGCYADESIQAITGRFRNMGVLPGDLEVRMFGGGNMFPTVLHVNIAPIGDRNIEAGRRLLETCGCALVQVDLAGEVHRKITFDIQTGKVEVQLGDKLGSAQKVKP